MAGILAALNVTDWAWPPYASNIVLEHWRRTETEALPRVGSSLFALLSPSMTVMQGSYSFLVVLGSLATAFVVIRTLFM